MGSLQNERGVLASCNRLDGDEASQPAPVNKLNAAVNLGEERVIAPAPNVLAGLQRCPTLPHDDRAAGDQLAAESLNAKPLRI
jgi:hypothetical protein